MKATRLSLHAAFIFDYILFVLTGSYKDYIVLNACL